SLILTPLLFENLDVLVGFPFVWTEQQEIGFPRTLGIGDNDVCRDGGFHGYPPVLLLRYGRLCKFDVIMGWGLGYTKAAMVYGRSRADHRGYQRVTRSTVVPITHTNAKGKTHYLHQGTTKTGKPKYHFSLQSEGTLAEFIPAGFEIYETPNAQVFL